MLKSYPFGIALCCIVSIQNNVILTGCYLYHVQYCGFVGLYISLYNSSSTTKVIKA